MTTTATSAQVADVLIPNDAYNPTTKLLVQTGKDGIVHLINRADLGHFNADKDQIVGELGGAMNGVWGGPAYYNGTIYYGPTSDPLTAFGISGGNLVGSGPRETSSNIFGYPGPTPTVSSNGATVESSGQSIQLVTWGQGSQAQPSYGRTMPRTLQPSITAKMGRTVNWERQ